MLTFKRLLQDIAFNKMSIGIAHAHRFPLLHEKHALRELLVYLDVDCVFDVGANEGQYAELLRSIGYDGQIVSFEPIPRLAKALREKAVYDASWYVESVALDSTRRHVEFNVASSHSLSSLHTPLSGGVFERDIAASERIGIDTDTLDDYFRKYQKALGFKRAFLKMDTQGHDLSVAAGAGEMLSEFYGLQSEVAIAPLYQDQPSLREAVTFYEERGFAINAVLPTHYAFPTLIEVDFLFINRRRIHTGPTTSYRRQRRKSAEVWAGANETDKVG